MPMVLHGYPRALHPSSGHLSKDEIYFMMSHDTVCETSRLDVYCVSPSPVYGISAPTLTGGRFMKRTSSAVSGTQHWRARLPHGGLHGCSSSANDRGFIERPRWSSLAPGSSPSSCCTTRVRVPYRQGPTSILAGFERRERMPKDTLESLNVPCLPGGFGQIITQLDRTLSIGLHDFNDQG